MFEPGRLGYVLSTGTLDAWLRQYEFVEWRREQGVEPGRDRLVKVEGGRMKGEGGWRRKR